MQCTALFTVTPTRTTQFHPAGEFFFSLSRKHPGMAIAGSTEPSFFSCCPSGNPVLPVATTPPFLPEGYK
ncbi:hypothetical protein AZH53_08295 [Methanomicrobiaceae archaeon CYW5]|nr:hypothetical protein [Methanovulcanius yangii]